MSLQIDLNSDLGESFGTWTIGDDEAMLQVVSSANVACGYHAGDPAGILRTLRAVKRQGVAVGVHVGYRDSSCPISARRSRFSPFFARVRSPASSRSCRPPAPFFCGSAKPSWPCLP